MVEAEAELRDPIMADLSCAADGGLEVEELALHLQMSALGLPSSFVVGNEREKNALNVRKRRWKPKKTAVFHELDENETVAQSEADDAGEPASVLNEDSAQGSGVWSPVWHDEYQQYYFYNSETLDSTWEVPEGLEEYAPKASAAEEIIEETKSVTVSTRGTTIEIGSTSTQELETGEVLVRSEQEVVITNELREAGISNPGIVKYWQQRYTLFSKFDCGIKMDEEGWFSVTPEVIARHQAARCASPVVIDAFTGVGGNAIQFALTCQHVIAIDKDPQKIKLAKHNAQVYGVAERIEFILGDFFELAPALKADVIFLSPPWGGPGYQKAEVYEPGMLQPKDGATLMKIANKIAPSIALFLPRNSDMNQFVALSKSFAHKPPVEIEKNIMNKRLKAITVYYGKFNAADRG